MKRKIQLTVACVAVLAATASTSNAELISTGNHFGRYSSLSGVPAIPGEVAAADGTIVNDPLSSLYGVALPDLQDRVVIGAGTTYSVGTTTTIDGVGYFALDPIIATNDAAVVPEPSTYAGLLGITCVSLLAYGWRRKRQQAA